MLGLYLTPVTWRGKWGNRRQHQEKDEERGGEVENYQEHSLAYVYGHEGRGNCSMNEPKLIIEL